jgi:multiple sugar transport system permease protein
MNNYTVQLGLRSFVDSTGKSDWGALLAMSVVTLLPVFGLFIFFQRLLIEGIATTGLRG